LREIEAQVRVAIRDAMNRKSRKPFYWGGLKGYEQLEAIAKALAEVSSDEPEVGYLRRLKMQVDRVVEAYRVNVDDLKEAHTWLRDIADCLRYPPSHATPEPSLSSEQVKQGMETLLQSFKPDLKRRPAQTALHGVWHRTWKAYGWYCPLQVRVILPHPREQTNSNLPHEVLVRALIGMSAASEAQFS
jgi:hypothetical protein